MFSAKIDKKPLSAQKKIRTSTLPWKLVKLHLLMWIMWYDQKLQNRYKMDPVGNICSVQAQE